MALVNTVLGPVDADDLGVTLVREALVNVVPGAQYGYDIRIDRAEVFEAVAAKLTDFRANGGGAIVDANGMFQGRDLALYEALSRATGVHIVASTGQGPEAMLGGYFLTPQTNPPTPWPADRFAEMFTREVTEGMVVPRLERRAAAGLVATAVTVEGMTPTDESLVRGAARTGLATGLAILIRCGSDALANLDIALGEGIPADQVVIADLDCVDAVAAGWPAEVARRGAWVAIDHAGSTDPRYVSDVERVALIVSLVNDGHADRVLVSSSATGVSFGEPGNDMEFSYVLTNLVPQLRDAGLADVTIHQILTANPANLLSVRK
jgi:phosphotriesterase-related protein